MKFKFLALLLISAFCITLFSCDNANNSDGSDDELVEGDVELTEPSKLSRAQAAPLIEKYNEIYGGENVYRFLAKENLAGSVILPRFYTINRTDFQNLINNHLTQDVFYASLAIVDKTYDFEETASGKAHLADLIFHNVRPYTTGYLRNGGEEDVFFDDAQPCPTDCEAGSGSNAGDEISMSVARTRISKYNNLYSAEIQYMTAHNGSEDRVEIPRYYAISRADFQGVLNTTEAEQVYVSLAAKSISEGHIFHADLILHDTNPGQQGGIAASEEDFYDFVKPCPKQCDTTSASIE